MSNIAVAGEAYEATISKFGRPLVEAASELAQTSCHTLESACDHLAHQSEASND